MGGNATGRQAGGVSGKNGDSPARRKSAKVALDLAVGAVQSLGVEPVMRRVEPIYWAAGPVSERTVLHRVRPH
jgi:hypothetical protein